MGMLLAHLKDTPQPPSERSELSIPAELDALILECLAKSPEARPATARILRERLEACPTSRDWDDRKAAEWWQQHAPEYQQLLPA
jgi:eukaryotic-like serine/threonine-protein kinase